MEKKRIHKPISKVATTTKIMFREVHCHEVTNEKETKTFRLNNKPLTSHISGISFQKVRGRSYFVDVFVY